MKTNHIPRASRIQNHLQILCARQEQFHQPMGGGNPYWHCTGCGRTDPQLSIEGGHRKGCPAKCLDKEIAHYKNLLQREQGE